MDGFTAVPDRVPLPADAQNPRHKKARLNGRAFCSRIALRSVQIRSESVLEHLGEFSTAERMVLGTSAGHLERPHQ